MKTPTLATVTFLPLSLLVGIYGMRFNNMPELAWKYAYFLLLGSMASIVIVTTILFRKKKWF
jgi:magnesium transporter